MRVRKIDGKKPFCRVRELRMTQEIRECLGEERFSKVASILQLPVDVTSMGSEEAEEKPIASSAASKTSFISCVLPEQKILYAKKRRCVLIANSPTPNKIASKFCAWLRSLGTDNSTSSINEEVLKELFEIQLENPTSTGIETRIKELPFLPDVISDAENIPQRSFRALHRLNILMDAKTVGKSIDRPKVSAGSAKKGWKFSKSQAEKKYTPSGIVPEDIAKFEYKFFDDPPIQLEC
nr:PREDICTED: uncharacterized protein LOC109039534 [Bemisia tabaci]